MGTYLQKLFRVNAPSHKELDITKKIKYKYKPDLVIHAAAYTNVAKAEKEDRKCWKVNVLGTYNLVNKYKEVPFVYISTEYAGNPVNFYSYTKLFGEVIVKKIAKKWLTIRTLFKPNPFPWKKAFIDQMTQGDYVDVIASLIVKEIEKWNKTDCKLVYVGTGRKNMYELARRTRPDVELCSIKESRVKLPADYL